MSLRGWQTQCQALRLKHSVAPDKERVLGSDDQPKLTGTKLRSPELPVCHGHGASPAASRFYLNNVKRVKAGWEIRWDEVAIPWGESEQKPCDNGRKGNSCPWQSKAEAVSLMLSASPECCFGGRRRVFFQSFPHGVRKDTLGLSLKILLRRKSASKARSDHAGPIFHS